jgi:hypothetical protein
MWGGALLCLSKGLPHHSNGLRLHFRVSVLGWGFPLLGFRLRGTPGPPQQRPAFAFQEEALLCPSMRLAGLHLHFWVSSFGFMVWVFRLWVSGLGKRLAHHCNGLHLDLRVPEFGFMEMPIPPRQRSGFGFQGLGFRV